MRSIEGLTALWLWPWTVAQTQRALVETALGAQKVVAARLPIIAAATKEPWSADYPELFRMVGEKSDAFGLSQRKVTAAARKIRFAGEANARDFGRLTGGTWLGPADWIAMAERNLAAWSALASLPGDALAPVHRRLVSNERRMRSRASGRAKPKG